MNTKQLLDRVCAHKQPVKQLEELFSFLDLAKGKPEKEAYAIYDLVRDTLRYLIERYGLDHVSSEVNKCNNQVQKNFPVFVKAIANNMEHEKETSTKTWQGKLNKK